MAFKIPFDLPPDVAIAQARAQNVVPPVEFLKMTATKRAQAFTASNLAKLDQIQAIADALSKSQANGETFADFQKWAKAQDFGLPKHRLETIYRNAVQQSYNAGHWAEFQEGAKDRPYLFFDAINDSRVRPSHLALDGVIRPVGDAYWKTHSQSLGHRCFLPGTQIRGNFQIGSKTDYSGPAVEIETATGKLLSVTANHPILTANGWVAAAMLAKGDDVLCDSLAINGELAGGVNNQQSPASVEQIFDALSVHAMGVADISSFDFHGDAKFGKGKVNVVGANCHLLYGVSPLREQISKNWKLILTNVASVFCGLLTSNRLPVCKVIKPSIFGDKASNVMHRSAKGCCNFTSGFTGYIQRMHLCFKIIINGISRSPCPGHLPLNGMRVAFNGRPFDFFSFAPATNLHVSHQKTAANHAATYAKTLRERFFTFSSHVSGRNFLVGDGETNTVAPWLSRVEGDNLLARSAIYASISKQTTENNVTDAALFENLINGHPGDVFRDKITSVRHFDFCGHVYDFQTEQGWMFAGGIVSSNCRCRLVSLSRDEAMRLGGVTQNTPAEGGPDAGWGANPREWGRTLRELMREKIAKAPPAVAAIAEAMLEETPDSE